MATKKFVCLHGHFYQPPRENAWLEEIETQDSAFPFHDWNERIHHECYLPNALARVLDNKGRIVGIINNYERMSFNFGPTLLSWIEKYHPDSYRQILRADQKSLEVNRGHGNAIAQVYNHVILPLSPIEDKITQVRWGIEDFRYRFGRDPESLWLSETACNEDTLKVLIEEGMKYVILSPYQAWQVRSMNSESWHDVSAGQIDPKRPYRCYLKDGSGRFIDIFFYDGPISKDAGFGEILWDARRFITRLESAVIPTLNQDQLIHIATDGETYGHHKPFGDRVLAYLLSIEAKKRGFTVTNYGAYLEGHPPEFEVRLKDGEQGEGTSWSCAHGIRRWKDHCGCRGDGPADWNQHWRKPLRDALDWLRSELMKIYETEASVCFKDIWAARNDYIQVLLKSTPERVEGFFAKHAKIPLDPANQSRCFKLLEMQRFMMFMYTSCAWFFTEISGIETVQTLQYALRAIELAEQVCGHSLEEEFKNRLKHAKSNISEFRDGSVILERFVKPHRYSIFQIAAIFGIESVLSYSLRHSASEEQVLYRHHLKLLDSTVKTLAHGSVKIERLEIRSERTLETIELAVASVHIGLYDFRCSIKVCRGREEFEALARDLTDPKIQYIDELLLKIDSHFGDSFFTLKDLPLKERTQIITLLTTETIDKISVHYENLYDESRRMNQVYRSLNLHIPQQVKEAAIYTLNKRFKEAVFQLAKEGFDYKKASKLCRILEDAKSFEVMIKKQEVVPFLSGELTFRIKELLGYVDAKCIQECLNLLTLCKKMQLEPDLRTAQNYLFFLMSDWLDSARAIPDEVRNMAPQILRLLILIKINPERFKQGIRSYFSRSPKRNPENR